MKTDSKEQYSGKPVPQEDTASGIRLNKYLSEAGVCSRREADRLIQAGEVTVDGRTAVMGERVTADQQIQVRGKEIGLKPHRILLAVNKPKGVIVTSEVRKGTTNIDQLLDYPERIFPIGRLDKDSQGLLLMTNDGDLVNKIMRAGNYHEKEYLVRTDRRITEDFLQKMSSGVEILDTITRPCKVEQMGDRSFRIVLTQGLNRQIRRMCEALGYRVLELKRIRIMNIELGDLKTGRYREVTGRELEQLEEMLQGSSSAPIHYE